MSKFNLFNLILSIIVCFGLLIQNVNGGCMGNPWIGDDCVNTRFQNNIVSPNNLIVTNYVNGTIESLFSIESLYEIGEYGDIQRSFILGSNWVISTDNNGFNVFKTNVTAGCTISITVEISNNYIIFRTEIDSYPFSSNLNSLKLNFYTGIKSVQPNLNKETCSTVSIYSSPNSIASTVSDSTFVLGLSSDLHFNRSIQSVFIEVSNIDGRLSNTQIIKSFAKNGNTEVGLNVAFQVPCFQKSAILTSYLTISPELLPETTNFISTNKNCTFTDISSDSGSNSGSKSEDTSGSTYIKIISIFSFSLILLSTFILI